VAHGLITHYRETSPAPIRSINVLVGETNDSSLNVPNSDRIKPRHVKEAIAALSRDVAEGCVGAGTGTICYGYKGGIGTASRVISVHGKGYTVGALVQTNFSGNLNIYGKSVPCGADDVKDGSCMIIVATDAPLDARQLRRVAKRGIIGMTATGSYLGHGSGDFCVAFSANKSNIYSLNHEGLRQWTLLGDDSLDAIFEATVETVQEAVYNSLAMARDTVAPDGVVVRALDLGENLYGI